MMALLLFLTALDDSLTIGLSPGAGGLLLFPLAASGNGLDTGIFDLEPIAKTPCHSLRKLDSGGIEPPFLATHSQLFPWPVLWRLEDESESLLSDSPLRAILGSTREQAVFTSARFAPGQPRGEWKNLTILAEEFKTREETQR